MHLRPFAGQVRIVSGFPPCLLALNAQGLGLGAEGLIVELAYGSSAPGLLPGSEWQTLLSSGKEYRLQIEGGGLGADEAALVKATLVGEEWRAHKAELRFAFTRVDEAFERLLAELEQGLPLRMNDDEGGSQRRKLDKRFF